MRLVLTNNILFNIMYKNKTLKGIKIQFAFEENLRLVRANTANEIILIPEFPTEIYKVDLDGFSRYRDICCLAK